MRDGSEKAQDGPKKGPKWLRGSPNWPKTAPRWLRNGPGMVPSIVMAFKSPCPRHTCKKQLFKNVGVTVHVHHRRLAITLISLKIDPIEGDAGSPGKSQKEGLEDQWPSKQLGGSPLALLSFPGPLALPSSSSMGSLELPRGIYF